MTGAPWSLPSGTWALDTGYPKSVPKGLDDMNTVSVLHGHGDQTGPQVGNTFFSPVFGPLLVTLLPTPSLSTMPTWYVCPPSAALPTPLLVDSGCHHLVAIQLAHHKNNVKFPPEFMNDNEIHLMFLAQSWLHSHGDEAKTTNQSWLPVTMPSSHSRAPPMGVTTVIFRTRLSSHLTVKSDSALSDSHNTFKFDQIYVTLQHSVMHFICVYHPSLNCKKTLFCNCKISVQPPPQKHFTYHLNTSFTPAPPPFHIWSPIKNNDHARHLFIPV